LLIHFLAVHIVHLMSPRALPKALHSLSVSGHEDEDLRRRL
jgi:hypothetical protein